MDSKIEEIGGVLIKVRLFLCHKGADTRNPPKNRGKSRFRGRGIYSI